MIMEGIRNINITTNVTLPAQASVMLLIPSHWAGLRHIGLGCVTLGWVASHWAGLRHIGLGCVTLGWVASHWAGFRHIGLGCVPLGWVGRKNRNSKQKIMPIDMVTRELINYRIGAYDA